MISDPESPSSGSGSESKRLKRPSESLHTASVEVEKYVLIRVREAIDTETKKKMLEDANKIATGADKERTMISLTELMYSRVMKELKSSAFAEALAKKTSAVVGDAVDTVDAYFKAKEAKPTLTDAGKQWKKSVIQFKASVLVGMVNPSAIFNQRPFGDDLSDTEKDILTRMVNSWRQK